MHSLGIAFALTSAAVWGSGDFSGGVAAKRGDPFQVLALSAGSGVVLLMVAAVIAHEGVPAPPVAAWAAAAGIAAAVGIASLYRGLAVGSAATVAPTAAVITASLPVLLNLRSAGLPSATQASGFIVAIAGIWLVARAPSARQDSRAGLGLASLAGAGFGGFLFLIARAPTDAVFAPLAVARAVTLVVALALMLGRSTPWPSPSHHPWALLAGLLDAGGNVFYLLARQHIRLDVAAVLSSLYPAATVALARLLSREPVSTAQWLGAAVCLGAVGLMTM